LVFWGHHGVVLEEDWRWGEGGRGKERERGRERGRGEGSKAFFDPMRGQPYGGNHAGAPPSLIL